MHCLPPCCIYAAICYTPHTATARRHRNAWTLDNTTMINPATGKRENAMTVGVHQRKWEMDSLSSVMKASLTPSPPPTPTLSNREAAREH